MKLTDILTLESIRVPLAAKDKISAITEMVDMLAAAGRISDRETVLKAVLDRERNLSTGIGKGLAVPHGKCWGCDKLVMAIAKPASPLEFDSKDGEPVKIIALLVSPPDKTGPHIQALARISRLMLTDTFRVAVASATTSEQLWDIIKKHEA